MAQSSRSEAIERQEQAVLAALRDLLPWQLSARAMEAHQPVDPKNSRLRTLLDDLARSQLWKLLSLPADLPYYEAQVVFASRSSHAAQRPRRSVSFHSNCNLLDHEPPGAVPPRVQSIQPQRVDNVVDPAICRA